VVAAPQPLRCRFPSPPTRKRWSVLPWQQCHDVTNRPTCERRPYVDPARRYPGHVRFSLSTILTRVLPGKMNGHAERLTNGETMPEGHVTGIPTIAVTEQRKPFVSTHGTKLQHPGT
jgi:hypothetical protein